MEEIKEDIKDKFKTIVEYMGKNKLVLNSDKTHLLVMTTSTQHRKYGDFGISLDTGNEIIEPVTNEKLLGCHVANNFKFNNHIRDNEKSMSNVLTSRMNALRKVAFTSSFKVRKMIAEGIIISNILYIITVYGGCSEYLLSLLQVIQNTAARCVTRLGWRTRVSVLLLQCGWLSVRQMVFYHTIVQLFKIKQDRKPVYLYDKISTEFDYKTRLATSNGIKENQKVKSDERKKSFTPRATRQWNKLPVSLRSVVNLKQFKKELKAYVRENVNIM